MPTAIPPDKVSGGPKVLPFYKFCPQVLSLNLTKGQNVIAKIAFGDLNPCDLEDPEERELAKKMFGGLDRVTPLARKLIVLRLGRGSGKTTLCAAYAVYTVLTADISMCGPGDIPYVIIVAPDKELAKLSVRMCREMIRASKAIERLIVSETAQSIQLRRIDGRMVRIEAFAAAKAGTPVRGKTILGWIGDEAEFFTSNEDGTTDFAVDDREIFRAMKPRMSPQAKGMLISTPWPTETYMGKLFEENWEKCLTATAIKAPTVLVRDEPHIREMVEQELATDHDNAMRELFCELDGFSGGGFFDVNALNQSLEPTPHFPHVYNPRWPVAVGCDLGFTRDSSAIAVCQFDGKYYRTVYLEEMRPMGNKPLKPSVVIRKFSEIANLYKAVGVVADTYYRESLREQLAESSLLVINAPEGSEGKAQVFQRARQVLHEGRCTFPEIAIGKRLVQQAKLVVSKPAPGGTVSIRIPRKIGMGHGDLVSAWTLAVHHLAHKHVQQDRLIIEPGDPEWARESLRRIVVAQEKQQNDYLKQIDKEVRAQRGYGRKFTHGGLYKA